MTDDQAPQESPAEPLWATLDSEDPTSALFAPTSDSGVLLSASCRAARKCRLGIHRETLAGVDGVRSEVSCPRDHEGGPRVAHGGWTAGVLDEMSGHALLLRNQFAVTGELGVKFLKPIPIERPLIGTAVIVGRDGRYVHVECELRLADAGVVVATSRAAMVRRPSDHFDRHQRWLESLDD